MGANWLITAFRVIISFIDWVVYGLISIVYDLFIDISSAGIFSQDTIQTFASRIYVFLGLIMVFKVSISLVNYIMNPDLFTDKAKGGGALLKGFMIALIGIVLVPYVFEMAYNLQAIILKNNVIGNLIVGMKADTNVSGSNNYTSKGGGKNMAYTTLSGFYHLNVDDLGLDDECIENPTAGGCLDLVTDDKVKDKITSSYNNKTPQGLLSIPVTSATVQVNGEKTYVMSYLVIISTLAGALIVYILALFCVDIAVRSVKLSFLQLIAPIPLIAKVDPKGDGVFNKWIKMCVSTYLDLFIRLAAIYLALFIINAITSDGVQNMSGGGAYKGFSGLLVKIMIIIGALLFAKELPKFFKDLTGIDLGGEKGSFNLAKKLGSVPLVGSATGNLARRTMGGFDAARNGKSFKAGWNKMKESDKGMFADLKKWDAGMRPYSADSRKKKVEGGEEYAAINSKWKNGDKKMQPFSYLDPLTGEKKFNFDAFDGRTKENYDKVYKHNAFKQSLMNVDKQDASDKKIRALYADAQRMGDAWEGGDYVNASGDTVHYNRDEFEKLSTAVDNSAKALKGLNDVHDTMRKQYADDAETQDAIKFRKYNEANPSAKIK